MDIFFMLSEVCSFLCSIPQSQVHVKQRNTFLLEVSLNSFVTNRKLIINMRLNAELRSQNTDLHVISKICIII